MRALKHSFTKARQPKTNPNKNLQSTKEFHRFKTPPHWVHSPSGANYRRTASTPNKHRQKKHLIRKQLSLQKHHKTSI